MGIWSGFDVVPNPISCGQNSELPVTQLWQHIDLNKQTASRGSSLEKNRACGGNTTFYMLLHHS